VFCCKLIRSFPQSRRSSKNRLARMRQDQRNGFG
jgi:hypothetical protein